MAQDEHDLPLKYSHLWSEGGSCGLVELQHLYDSLKEETKTGRFQK